MDPNIPQNQADTESVNRMQTLENELEDLKKKATGESSLGTGSSYDKGPSGNARPVLLRIAFFLIIAAIAFTGLAFARNAFKSTSFSFGRKATPVPSFSAMPSIEPESSLSPEVASWLTYVSDDGIFNFKYPALAKAQPYVETVNRGVRIIDGGLDLKVIYINKIGKSAQIYSAEMRTKALGQPDRKNLVGEVVAVSFQGVDGYIYEIKGYGVAQDYYFDTGSGLVRVEVYYNGTDAEIATYASSVKQILDTLKIEKGTTAPFPTSTSLPSSTPTGSSPYFPPS